MTNGAAAGGAAAAAAAIANAIKASGAIVYVEQRDFEQILNKISEPLVVYAQGGFLSAKHKYLTSYKGLFFYTKTKVPINLPGTVETILAKKIWIPG
jgi:hypothetical protein